MTSRNQQTVERYLDGFRTGNREQILSCLTDDITWTVFGAYRVTGKDGYAEHITEPGFSRPPQLTVVRMVEDGDTVMAELTGDVVSDAGDPARLAMAEVFVIRDGLISERRAFVIPLQENDYR
ncbi:MAG: nuclear transport factor 2 family protein [Propionibacteriaceae bacterium]|nr:nuclear transport factor 2 family protein [Propionibacteriaceae bacterium]